MNESSKNASIRKVIDSLSGKTVRNLSTRATNQRKISNMVGGRPSDKVYQNAVDAGRSEVNAIKKRNIARAVLGSGLLGGSSLALVGGKKE